MALLNNKLMKDILKLTLKLAVVLLISGAWLWFADLLWRRGHQSYLLALTIPGVPALLSFFCFLGRSAVQQTTAPVAKCFANHHAIGVFYRCSTPKCSISLIQKLFHD
jgi:hypothetical protein